MRVVRFSLFAALIASAAIIAVACSDSYGSDGGSSSGDSSSGDASDGSTPAETGGDVCPEGTPSPNQLAGDCKSVVCGANGTTQTVTDDTDVPATECATATCANGALSLAPKGKGTVCAGGFCDGMGTCVQGLGSACAAPSTCPSGFCVDGVCCEEACSGECKACNNEGSLGFCSNIAYYKEDPSYIHPESMIEVTCTVAIGGARCDGKGKCLRTIGIPCNDDATCMSGECASNKCLGAKGELCDGNGDCLSGTCSVGACL